MELLPCSSSTIIICCCCALSGWEVFHAGPTRPRHLSAVERFCPDYLLELFPLILSSLFNLSIRLTSQFGPILLGLWRHYFKLSDFMCGHVGNLPDCSLPIKYDVCSTAASVSRDLFALSVHCHVVAAANPFYRPVPSSQPASTCNPFSSTSPNSVTTSARNISGGVTKSRNYQWWWAHTKQPANNNRMSCLVLELIVRTQFSTDQHEHSEDKGKSHEIISSFQFIANELFLSINTIK